MFERFLYTLPMALGQFFLFALIVGILGAIIFFVGESLPRSSFDYTAFPYRSFSWERDGKIYERLAIRRWKDNVPDMSKYVKTTFAKKIASPRDPEYTRKLVLETCSAELVHNILLLVSPIFPVLMEGIYGYIGMAAYILGNLPFIVIQRYNRPRLIRLMERQRESILRNKVQKAGF